MELSLLPLLSLRFADYTSGSFQKIFPKIFLAFPRGIGRGLGRGRNKAGDELVRRGQGCIAAPRGLRCLSVGFASRSASNSPSLGEWRRIDCTLDINLYGLFVFFTFVIENNKATTEQWL